MIDTRTAPYAALILRLTMGVLFLVHDAMKFFVFTPAGFIKYFAHLGLPAGVAWFIMLLELVGGVTLILGLWIRWMPIILAIEMAGIIYFVHFHNGFFFTNPGGGWEYPAFWGLALISLALLGPGAFAVGG